LNKNDFDRFWTACVPREARASNENIFDDVIKAIDNSEKWNKIDTEYKTLQDTVNICIRNKEIVELLKKLDLHKLILRLTTLDTTKGHSNFQDSLIEKLLDNADELIELQKVLGDEEFIKKFKIGYEDEE